MCSKVNIISYCSFKLIATTEVVYEYNMAIIIRRNTVYGYRGWWLIR